MSVKKKTIPTRHERRQAYKPLHPILREADRQVSGTRDHLENYDAPFRNSFQHSEAPPGYLSSLLGRPLRESISKVYGEHFKKDMSVFQKGGTTAVQLNKTWDKESLELVPLKFLEQVRDSETYPQWLRTRCTLAIIQIKKMLIN